MPTWDETYARLTEPGIAALIWLGLGALGWYRLSRRTRVASLSALGAVLAVALGPLFELLANFGTSIFVGFVESGLLFADLTLFFAPTLVAVDRVLRQPLRGLARWQPQMALVAAAATGLAACWAALGALWWVTEIKPELVGSVEVAVFGGVATACIAMIRADRMRDGDSAPRLR